jgi:hypothetical protein
MMSDIVERARDAAETERECIGCGGREALAELLEGLASALDAKDRRIAELEAKIIENAEDFAEYNRAEGKLIQERDELVTALRECDDPYKSVYEINTVARKALAKLENNDAA